MNAYLHFASFFHPSSFSPFFFLPIFCTSVVGNTVVGKDFFCKSLSYIISHVILIRIFWVRHSRCYHLCLIKNSINLVFLVLALQAAIGPQCPISPIKNHWSVGFGGWWWWSCICSWTSLQLAHFLGSG